MPSTSPPTPSTSCCSAATRWRASHWPRSRRCRCSRTQPAAARSTTWGASWRRVLSSATAAGWGGRRITIDLDPTDDPTHGAQQYSLFNGYYDNWCYLPLLAFLTFDREPEQYLCSAVLRHGKAVASEGGVALLARLLPRCAVRFHGRAFWFGSTAAVPGAVRLPGCTAAARLRGGDGEQRRVAAARRAGDAGGAGAQRAQRADRASLHGPDYAAGTWSDARRVIIKAEVVRLGDREPRDNPRASW